MKEEKVVGGGGHGNEEDKNETNGGDECKECNLAKSYETKTQSLK